MSQILNALCHSQSEKATGAATVFLKKDEKLRPQPRFYKQRSFNKTQ